MLPKKRLAIVVLVIAVISLSSILTFIPLISKASNSVNWSNLHGVAYNWTPIWKDPGGGTPAPNVSMPLMVSHGINFDEQPIFWGNLSANPSAYLSSLTILANEADLVGIKVVYDFQSVACGQFPTNVITASGIHCPDTNNAFMTAYESDSFNVGSQSVWAYQMSNFWQPVIAAMDSHASTIGYELIDEPPICCTALQNYHNWFATQIRALTDKAIVVGSYQFDKMNNNDAYLPPASVCTARGDTCVIDVHLYNAADPSSYFSNWASIAKSAGYPIYLGQFGPCQVMNTACTSLSSAYVQNFINTYVQDAHNDGLGMSYWFWNCQENGPTDWQSLLTAQPACQPDALLGFLSTAYVNILGATTTSTTTSSTSSTNSTTSTSYTSTSSSSTSTTTAISTTIVTETCQIVMTMSNGKIIGELIDQCS